MPASRHQDHTTLPSASRALVLRAAGVHRTRTNVRDDRETPLASERDDLALLLFLPLRKAENFSKDGWTRRANQCRGAVGWTKRSRPRQLNARRRKACPPYELLPPPLRGRVGVGGSPKRVCPCGPPPPTPPRKGEGSRAAGWAKRSRPRQLNARRRKACPPQSGRVNVDGGHASALPTLHLAFFCSPSPLAGEGRGGG